MQRKHPLTRFLQKLKILNDDFINECWVWQGYLDKDGYGQFSLTSDRPYRAHRFSYSVFRGGLDPNLTIDHTCNNRACVNPRHLEQVTIKENVNRGYNHYKVQTHCKHGHELSGQNLKIRIRKTGNIERVCRKCRNYQSSKSHKKHFKKVVSELIIV